MSSDIFNIDVVFHRATGLHPESLHAIPSDPIPLVEFLSTTDPQLQSRLKPFVAGLESGRLQPLDPTNRCHGSPQLFKVKDANPDLDLADVFGMAIMKLDQSTIYQGDRKTRPIEFQPGFVIEFTSGTAVGEPKTAFNIPLGISFHTPPDIEQLYHAFEAEGDADSPSANIGTAGSVVDLHEGNAQPTRYVGISITNCR